MRTFEGIEVDQDWVDALVKEYERGRYKIEFLSFMRKNTGWGVKESEEWFQTGILPK